MNSDNILVKLNNVGFSQNDKWLVKDVSLIVEKGKIVTLIGPNGSGKSTTAKIALGIYKNIEGNVEKYTDNIGYVPQKISIDWTLPLRVYDFMLLTEDISDEVIDEALVSEQVVDVFDAAGIKRPDISILSEEFLMEIKDMKHQNLALETLKKLLNDEIKVRSKTNFIQSRSLMEMLESSIQKYQKSYQHVLPKPF